MRIEFLITSLIVVAHPRVLTWMRRTFASAFVLLGAKLATTDR